jgi:glycerol-3-phosphate acyltransferase PlsY
MNDPAVPVPTHAPVLPPLLIIAAYLLGALPTAYLLVRALRGIDIRTVGSGNVGATNAGRILGRWAFWCVFLVDLAKGFLPVWGVPRLFPTVQSGNLSLLPVLLGLAAILGHNFPPYLGFKGGKGVATSLGVVLALDPPAALAAAFGFVISIYTTRYVSVSSVFAGFVFVLIHAASVLAQGRSLWQPQELPMSLLCIVLIAMMTYRHRANFKRIAQGTEPRVNLRKSRSHRPAGHARVITVLAIVAVAATLVCGTLLWMHRPTLLECGRGQALVVADHVSTGQQRASRLFFFQEETRLAVACPRYQTVMLYRVAEPARLEPEPPITVEGRPVAFAETPSHLLILQRPAGDARHIEPGFYQALDLQSRTLGPRREIGWDPDDLVMLPDGQHCALLLSGHAEGESNRPQPALEIWSLPNPGAVPTRVAHVPFTQPGDDPLRLALSSSGHYAVVSLAGSRQAASFDLTDPARPVLLSRTALPALAAPYLSSTSDDAILMPIDTSEDAILMPRPHAPALSDALLLTTRSTESALEVFPATDRKPIGKLPLRGHANFTRLRPVALAVAPKRSLAAVAHYSGAVSLLALRSLEIQTPNRPVRLTQQP